MNTVEIAAVIAFALPLAAALFNGLNTVSGNKVYSPAAVATTALWAVFASFAASVTALIGMIAQAGPHQVSLFEWIGSGDLSVDVSFLVDRLTMVMMLLVTAVGWLVTRFSVNYLHNEPGFCRYFTVMPLFVAAMLLLVMADNYVLLFLGWEGVGICSYLLIGFYRNRASAAHASTKAFVMNRISDAGLLLAIFLMFDRTGSVVFTDVFAAAGTLPSNEVTGLCFLLLLGSIAKSAQLPLGTWLAQAMEGPTPSSALIHAATMVTAGVYLVVRSSPLFDQAPTALLAVGIVGALTAVYGQLVGYTQTDIKGMLAASTTAQLGLMFVLCGLGLYSVAIFHLVAHAFYKSYLFLTAPSILHHLHGGADPGAVRRPSGTVPKLSALVLFAGAGLMFVPVMARGFSDADPVFARNVWTIGGIGLIALYSVVLASTRMV